MAATALLTSLSRGAAAAGLPAIESIVVHKRERALKLLAGGGEPVRTYRVALGFAPEGAKRREGDGRTPEGFYVIDGRNPDSRFHRALSISYPGPADHDRATRKGMDPGGEIMLHGLPNGATAADVGHPREDWTAGCIALTNAEIEEIWRLVPDGTPIVIYP